MNRINQILSFAILLFSVIDHINIQENRDGQVDFNTAHTSVQSGITRAMKSATLKVDQVWLFFPIYK